MTSPLVDTQPHTLDHFKAVVALPYVAEFYHVTHFYISVVVKITLYYYVRVVKAYLSVEHLCQARNGILRPQLR